MEEFFLGTRCIYWWNPLSYMIRRLIKDTAEYANDIRLTKDRDELTRTNYMLSLLNTSKQTHTFHTLPTLHFQEGTILNIEKRCDLISDSPKIRRNLFSQFIHIGSISLFRCALSFSQVHQLQTMTMMALLFFINLTAVILFM